MTHYIGTIPIPSINNIEIGDGTNYEEIDLIDEDKNVVLKEEEKGTDISIDFTLVEMAHPTKNSVEEQREAVKSLKELEEKTVTIDIGNLKGRISIDSVSIPLDGNNRNIVQGSITGKYLPWPEYFPEEEEPMNRSGFGSTFGHDFGR